VVAVDLADSAAAADDNNNGDGGCETGAVLLAPHVAGSISS
jgi:hypothetical protein